LKETISSFPFRLSEVNSDAKAYKFIETIKIGGKMSTPKEVVEERFPWLLVILVPLAIGFIGPVWQLLLPGSPYVINNSLGESVCNIGMTTAPFLVLILTAPFYRIETLRRRLGIKTLAYLYISSLIASYFILYPWALGTHYVYASRFVASEVAESVIPDFMCPPVEVCRVLDTGGPINWSAWAIPIAWFWISNVTLGLFFLSISTSLRKLWIDIEKVPFPQTIVVYELAENNTAEKGWCRPFIIGVAIGLLFEIPVTLTGIFPWFPDIYGVNYRSCPMLTRWFGGDEPLGTIAGMINMSYNPVVVAMAYMAPLSVLFSTWFFALLYIVLTQIAYAIGFYTGITSIGTCGRHWCSPSPQTDPPFKFYAIDVGALIMFGIMHLILSRRYIAETFRIASKGSSSPKEEDISYRTCYIMMAATLIATLAFWMWSGLSFIDALFVPITVFFIVYPMVRMFGVAGTYWRGYGKGLTFYRILHPTVHSPPTTQEFLIYKVARTAADCPSYPWAGAFFSSFASYKFASLAEVSSRNAFKAILVALLIAPLASHIGFLWTLHTFGGSHLYIWNSWYKSGGAIIQPTPEEWSVNPATDPWIEYAALGAVIIAVLSWLHARFIWFPLEPIGFILGTTSPSTLFGLWSAFLAAWILKVITLRIGGAKFYEEYGTPIASGVITGCMIGMILGGLLLIIRFFIPF